MGDMSRIRSSIRTARAKKILSAMKHGVPTLAREIAKAINSTSQKVSHTLLWMELNYRCVFKVGRLKKAALWKKDSSRIPHFLK